MMNNCIKLLIALMTMLSGCILTSCDIDDNAGDCSVHYKVPFTFTQNIQNTDAFAKNVAVVTLYVYDASGHLVLRKSESGEALKKENYAMDVDLLPGRYSMLAWCEGTPTYTPATSFVIGSDDSDITGLSATLSLEGDNGSECNRDIIPLFHGYNSDVEVPDTYGEVLLPAIDLTKDTNIINVTVENIDGTEISPANLQIYIETDNGMMNWDNSLNGNIKFRHNPWCVTPFSSIRGEETATRGADSDDTDRITGLLAEFTTGRLMTGRKPRLVIHRSNHPDDVKFDLVRLLCMVRGHYNGNYTDQEYLDRMDFHELTFFVDENLNWYTAAGIYINGWNVVPPQDENL